MQPETITAGGPVRHPIFPQTLTDAKLAEYIKENAARVEPHFTRRYFTDEEIQGFEHESANHGRTIVRLSDLLKTVKELIKNGSEEDVRILIPQTIGTKSSEEFRAQNYKFIEDGFEEIETTVYGFPDEGTKTMQYFTISGEIVEDRSRRLTLKEQKDFFGAKRINMKLIDESKIDRGTGEVQE